jgi:hypothetical protein
MALISTKIHGALDYAGGLGSLAAPKLIGDRRAAALMGVSGAGSLTTSALTDYELGLRRAIPMRAHLLIDVATGSLLLGGAVALRRRGVGLRDYLPLALVGLAEVAGAAVTSTRPGDRTGAPGASSPPTASSPPASSPAVPTSPAVAIPTVARERQDLPDDDVLTAREESAAAAEAARIGGPAPADARDPTMEPVYEAGGGEQEGWEAAETDLMGNASHGDGRGSPIRDALTPEPESDRSGASYGEADDETGPDDR